jgi:hypothetical protein
MRIQGVKDHFSMAILDYGHAEMRSEAGSFLRNYMETSDQFNIRNGCSEPVVDFDQHVDLFDFYMVGYSL